MGWLAGTAFAVALLASMAAKAATVELPTAEPPRAITMTGEAEVKAPPDQAVVSAGAVTQARTASQAVAANAAIMTRVFDALAKLNIPRSAIATSGFSLEPQYPPDSQKPQPHVVLSYEVSNSIEVTLDAVARAGAVLDALIDAGANQSAGVSFNIKDPKPLLDQARAEAAKDALHRAQVYGRNLGVNLGPVLSVNEGDGALPEARGAPVLFKASRAATPIEAGQQSVSASVTVEWGIQ
jgi:uncharacterized protein YggE